MDRRAETYAARFRKALINCLCVMKRFPGSSTWRIFCMKRIFYALTFAALTLGLCACASNQPTDTDHHSETNLDSETGPDWAGVYTGTIPSASGSGINVTITLSSDLTYEVRYQYIGREDGDSTTPGTFKWDKDSGVITLLDADSLPPYYQVGENKLTQLDMEGKPITGMLADDYVLRKQ